MRSRSIKQVTPQNFGIVFLHEQFDDIYKQCNEDFKEMISYEQFNDLARSFNSNVKNYELISETTLNNVHSYVWVDDQQEKAINVMMDSHNRIHGLLLKPFLSFPEIDKKYTQNTYNMPVNEEWYVFWGGVNEFINYHYAYETQRYAYDLVIMKNGMYFGMG